MESGEATGDWEWRTEPGVHSDSTRAAEPIMAGTRNMARTSRALLFFSGMREGWTFFILCHLPQTNAPTTGMSFTAAKARYPDEIIAAEPITKTGREKGPMETAVLARRGTYYYNGGSSTSSTYTP